ncbi:hypothetical protein K435DRAFT_869222 [Dendrothele bispora CBS 962.96]|uniref:Uncharacterized protein n=1 Tax=Dendrothele bispora (strain CBS 962.96) TaxID=1314807 RepID=A0A4S8LAC5_DENBC|nr:hypothetical protein K435DRAFT_869222 [Dendrothele bispora CBS 962.96]
MFPSVPHSDILWFAWWASSCPLPLPACPLQSFNGVDYFTSIGPEGEWNHNPDASFFELNGGLVLGTASVTTDLYVARNTITHGILGPKVSGTILLDVMAMTDGDRASIFMFRQISTYIGVKQSGNMRQLVSSSGGTSDWVNSRFRGRHGCMNGNSFTNLGNTLNQIGSSS